MPTIRMTPDQEAAFIRQAQERGGTVNGRGAVSVPIVEVATTFADEGELQDAIIKRAKAAGWLAYHTRDSRRCEPGFPDLILLRGSVMLVVELKRSKRLHPTAAQKRWLKAFQLIPGAVVRIWSPEDWQEITRELA